ncbi:tRNA pseudouridine(38-40) synthase TruA [Candidimonas nitroreducens]|uniref:tRNA pseudouridine synthase A n=1 Tax=Candidimonas nitroreducens TaxID=683354 RepID=A0A225LZV1_9BURK|nr:tRNA pseudouridine(38-40) synthase TruA [Candidimonas nitroreducens]OWT54476.1 tRNA pseudouridine(38-40) synthase TruA [Candidimonas nitroreducens]
MVRMALGISYDGAPWHGWQTQPGGRTVQDALEAALSQFLAGPAATICAGRTDTGVHALGQVVHLDTTAQRRDESWIRGLNALLPSSIAVQWAQAVPDDFHARFAALSRTYIYVLRNARVRAPLAHGRVGWVARSLELEPMAQAAAHLLGEHDFSSFRSSQCQAASPVRTLHELGIVRHGEYFIFTLRANAFLHHMVRNLIGALVYVGLGRQQPGWMRDLLAQKDRRLAAPTFAADGLYFAQVEYPARYGLPAGSPQEALARIPGW